MRLKSRTVDEIQHHILGPYNYLKTGEWPRGNINPPFSVIFYTLPLLFIKDTSIFNGFEKATQLEYIFDTKS